MSNKVFDLITKLFEDRNIKYKHINHEPTPTSEDAARVRGMDIATGGKALVLKVGGIFKIFVISQLCFIPKNALDFIAKS